jgi:hypothetical protein
MPALKNPLNEILGQLSGKSSPTDAFLAKEIPALAEIRSLLTGGRIQARMPFTLNFY